jgi:hypothetical protein
MVQFSQPFLETLTQIFLKVSHPFPGGIKFKRSEFFYQIGGGGLVIDAIKRQFFNFFLLFLSDLQAERKTFDIVQCPWQQSDTSEDKFREVRTRFFSYGDIEVVQTRENGKWKRGGTKVASSVYGGRGVENVEWVTQFPATNSKERLRESQCCGSGSVVSVCFWTSRIRSKSIIICTDPNQDLSMIKQK